MSTSPVVGPADVNGWTWDVTLFAGTAEHYERGRLPYAPGLDEAVARLHPGHVGSGRLLDVGCGPGTLTFLLRYLFAEVVGIDPDPGMIHEARRRATEAGVTGVEFVQARAEDLPLGLGTFTVAAFGQSFHWMDRHRVANAVYGMLPPGGLFIQVSDRKDAPPPDTSGQADPVPPYDRIHELVRAHLGPVRRAGRGVLPNGTPGGEAAVLARTGFGEPERIVIPAGQIVLRTPDDVVSWVHSRSDSAPALFGEGLETFDEELRALLHVVAPGGRFAEPLPASEIIVWRRPPILSS